MLVFIAILWIAIIAAYRPWQKNVIVNDVVSYYGYLPAAFIHGDLKLGFTENTKEYKYKFWPEKAANGGKVIKTTMGLSILYAPFFVFGHTAALVSGEAADGFSAPYQIAVIAGGLFYLLLGFYYLRKTLLLYFPDKITAFTLLSVFAGTNLLWYSTMENLMSHQYIFSLLSIFIWHTIRWHKAPTLKTALYIGLLGGLLTLIRPTMIFCFLFFALYHVYNLQTLKEKWKLCMSNKVQLLLMAFGVFFVFLPQLFYWKYVTDQWFFFSYVGERFYFDHPHLAEGLFGFRKGWLLYTPMMGLALAGLFFMRKKAFPLFLPVALISLLMIYVLLSWWAWWYGGTFGNRAFIDWYPLLVFPLAGLYNAILERGKTFLKTVLIVCVCAFTALNMFQSWQFSRELIHYESMTKGAYFEGFFATRKTQKWEELLDEPAYDRARSGLPESYSEEEIKAIKPTDVICLKGSNRLIISCEINSTTALSSSKNYIAAWETFLFIRKENNKISWKANNKKYVSADLHLLGKLVANRDVAGPWETFELIYLGNNRIALKADNHKYVSIDPQEPHMLIAKSDTITARETFRIYIN